MQSDSLIKNAVDYYLEGDDKVKIGKAFLYYGKVLDLQKNEAMAMKAYLDAYAALEKTKEYKMLALIQQYMGSLNSDRKMYDMALNNYRRSIFYSTKTSDTLKIVYSYRNIAWIYEIKQNCDSATWYAKTGISLLKGIVCLRYFLLCYILWVSRRKREKTILRQLPIFVRRSKMNEFPISLIVIVCRWEILICNLVN